jgi:hypothetical protein
MILVINNNILGRHYSPNLPLSVYQSYFPLVMPAFEFTQRNRDRTRKRGGEERKRR